MNFLRAGIAWLFLMGMSTVGFAGTVADDADSTRVLAGKEAPLERNWAIGVSGGIPQIAAFSVERRIEPGFRVQGNIGSLLIVSSVSARVLVMPEGLKLYPYLFAGLGYFYILEVLESSDTSALFSWWGGGFRFRIKRVVLFAEVGQINELDNDPAGFPRTGMAAGLLISFGGGKP